ncbi:MAG TPA: 2OG-Fe(II) oxygenase [Terriglobales bacterium]|nr:2OG-Fe(II) oxygenase [Terriglobales bacterium]
MTAREMIDNLSGTLLCDERILSVPEKELLANLLRRTRTTGNASEHAVTEAITRTVGEIIAERALGVFGESLSRQLLEQHLAALPSLSNRNMPVIRAGATPSTPAPPPGSAPRPPGTSPPSVSFATTQPKTGGVAVAEADNYLPAECVVLDEFLTVTELNQLRQFVFENEMRFEMSEVLSPGVAGGAVDYEHRRSRVLLDLGGNEKMITDRLRTCLPRVLQRWGRDTFSISRIETQVTASNHGDYFHCHSDNGVEEVADREITFVYFFHREPKQFSGGDLRIYDSRRENDNYIPTANYRTIVPEQNQLVLFASGLSHEITPVECPSGKFADSRFTVNGWFRK